MGFSVSTSHRLDPKLRSKRLKSPKDVFSVQTNTSPNNKYSIYDLKPPGTGQYFTNQRINVFVLLNFTSFSGKVTVRGKTRRDWVEYPIVFRSSWSLSSLRVKLLEQTLLHVSPGLRETPLPRESFRTCTEKTKEWTTSPPNRRRTDILW